MKWLLITVKIVVYTAIYFIALPVEIGRTLFENYKQIIRGEI
jgi:hypothetical protein